MSSTAWLSPSTNNIIQFFDSSGNIGIANSSPGVGFDCAYIANFRSNLTIQGNLINTGFTSLSNLALWSSNTSTWSSNTSYAASNTAYLANSTAIWSSNTSYYSSNLIVTTSNYAYPGVQFSSNAGVFASNLVVTTSNYAYPGVQFSSNAGVFSSNLIVTTSNYAYPGIVFSSNAGVYGSNLSVTSSNYLYPTANYSSNTSYYSSNLIVTTSNYAYPAIQFSSNTAVAASNKIFGYSFNNFPGYIMKSLDTSNNINIVVSWQTPSTNNAYQIVLETTQSIGNQSMWGQRKQRLSIGMSNSGITYQEGSDTFGFLNAYSSLFINSTASSPSNCTLTSYTNWATTGTMCHIFGVQVVNSPCTTIGNISLS